MPKCILVLPYKPTLEIRDYCQQHGIKKRLGALIQTLCYMLEKIKRSEYSGPLGSFRVIFFLSYLTESQKRKGIIRDYLKKTCGCGICLKEWIPIKSTMAHLILEKALSEILIAHKTKIYHKHWQLGLKGTEKVWNESRLMDPCPPKQTILMSRGKMMKVLRHLAFLGLPAWNETHPSGLRRSFPSIPTTLHIALCQLLVRHIDCETAYNPRGHWRSKQEDHSFTYSVSVHQCL